MAKVDRLCVTAVLPPSSIEPSHRGIKRSRSPDQYGELAGEEDDDGMWTWSAGSDGVCQTPLHVVPSAPSV